MASTNWVDKSLTPDPRTSSVEDLSGMVHNLAPSGEAAGNQVTGQDYGGSAPGSAGSTPMPSGDELVQLPKPDIGAPYPKASPRPRGQGPSHKGTVS